MELLYDIKEEKTLFNKLIKTANEHFNLDNFTQSFPKIILRMFFKLEDEDIEDAVRGLGSNDEGIDAFFVDDKNKIYYLIQFKSRVSYQENNNKNSDKNWFTLLQQFTQKIKLEKFNSKNKRIMSIRNEILNIYEDYTIEKHIFHLGYSTEEILNNHPDVEYYDIKSILDKFTEYYEYEIEESNIEEMKIHIKNNDFRKYNSENNFIKFTPKSIQGNKRSTIIFTLNGNQVVKLLEHGTTIFDRNIRGFLGETQDINKKMIETAINYPEEFYFYNNGITITCEEFETNSLNNPEPILKLKKPQIINGAQTVNSIYVAYNKFRKKLEKEKNKDFKTKIEEHFNSLVIICKVIESNKGENTKLTQNVTRYSNTQNKIKFSDFYSNRDEQKKLQEIFEQNHIYYEIKRGIDKNTNKENKITMEVLAEHYYAQNFDPFDAKSGDIFNQNFDEENKDSKYFKIFNEKKSYVNEFKEKYLQAYYIYDYCNQNLKILKKTANLIEETKVKGIISQQNFFDTNQLFISLTNSKSTLEDYFNNNVDYRNNNTIHCIDLFELKLMTFIMHNFIENSYFKKEDDESKTERVSKLFKKAIVDNDKKEINRILGKIIKIVIKIYVKILKSYKNDSEFIIKFRRNVENIKKFKEEVKEETSEEDYFITWEF